MARKVKALIPFPSMKDDELLVAAETILAAMEGNDSFPDPVPELGKRKKDLECSG